MPRPAAAAGRTPLILGALLLGLAAWCLAPVHRPRGARAPISALLCDVSPSVTRARPDWRRALAGELAREAARAEDSGAEFVALCFALERTRLVPPARPTRAEAWLAQLATVGGAQDSERAASDLWGACAALGELCGERPLARLVLWSDGQATGRDPTSLLGALLVRAAECELRDPGPPELDGLALVDLELPRASAVGAPLAARAWLRFVRGSGSRVAPRARLEIALDTPAGPLAWTQAVPLDAAGDAPWPLDLPLGPAQAGTTRLDLRARLLPDGDAVAEDDLRWATCQVGPELAVGVLSSSAARARAMEFAAGLSSAGGLSARVLASDELGESLARDDVLVLYDAAWDQLPAEALAGFVERGGGLLACAGPACAQARVRSAPAAQLLPLDFALPGPEPRDVVLLVDGSGSMLEPAGQRGADALEQARRTALQLLEAAGADERVVLRLFGAGLGPELDVALGLRDLRGLAPGGATDIPAALGSLAAQQGLARRPALALLITDGRDQPRDRDALAGLRERLALARVELSIFAVGPEPDLEFLGRLAGERLRLAVVDGSVALDAALQRAASAQRERSDGPYAAAFAEPFEALPSAAFGARARSGAALQPRASYRRAQARPTAQVAWIAADGAGRGEPLLALARRGRGACAALADLPNGRDATELAGLLRWLAEGCPDERPRLSAGPGRLLLDDVPAEWPAELFARSPGADQALAVRLAPPDETLVDPRDRRSGAWDGELPAQALFELSATPDGPPLAALVARTPPTPEFPWPTDGRVARLFAVGRTPGPHGPEPLRGPHPLGLPLLALALAALTWAGLTLGRPPGPDQGGADADR